MPKIVVGLGPTFDIRFRSPGPCCLDRGRTRKILGHAPDNQQGHGDEDPRCSEVASRVGGLGFVFPLAKAGRY